MFNNIEWNKPEKWHIGLSAESASISERIVRILFFTGFTAICAQIAFSVPWTPVPYTFQTFAVLATGVYLRRNDAFASGCLNIPCFRSFVSIAIASNAIRLDCKS